MGGGRANRGAPHQNRNAAQSRECARDSNFPHVLMVAKPGPVNSPAGGINLPICRGTRNPYIPASSYPSDMRFIVVLVMAASAAAAQQLTFVPFHQSGIYQLGEKTGWNVTRPAATSLTEKLAFTIKKNDRTVLKTGTLDVSSGTAKIEITVDEPAMLYVQV